MKELIGIVLVGLFGFAIWKTRQVATTAPRCPTVDELEAINHDILDGKTDLVDAENLARSYDAIAGCDTTAMSIRATILAKKSAGALGATTTKAKAAIASPGAASFVDLLAPPALDFSDDPRVLALPDPWRMNARNILVLDPAKLNAGQVSSLKSMYDLFKAVPATDPQKSVFDNAAAALGEFIHLADPADSRFGASLIFPLATETT